MRTGRQAPLLRFRLVPSAFAGRAVPPGVTCSEPSRCGVAPTSAPTPGSRLAHAVFSASRLRCFQLRALETPPARVIRGRFLSAHVPGPRRAVLATWPGPSKSRRRPWDSPVPFAVLLPPAGDDASPAFVAPTCRFATCRREFHRRGVHLIGRTKGLWPRLLGFGPADEPCRVICRPRYSFYAQGRSNPPADTAMGFSLLSGFHRAGLRRAIADAPWRPWALRLIPRRACSAGRGIARALRRREGPDD
jgi:hypothetical protein